MPRLLQRQEFQVRLGTPGVAAACSQRSDAAGARNGKSGEAVARAIPVVLRLIVAIQSSSTGPVIVNRHPAALIRAARIQVR
jgi:hypothetical protein